jgi:catechol 2,3-dioxygenase-like lactoylglutathione lyase family enzyme
MTSDFPAEGMELTHLLVVRDAERSKAFYRWEVRGFFRDPDGHLLEISEVRTPG